MRAVEIEFVSVPLVEAVVVVVVVVVVVFVVVVTFSKKSLSSLHLSV